ncbi:CPBP family glutamic-type intramembrane protease [Naasia lichenicola]|nr:CPBP family glutamic-type intramembrane protease [Naasia lichenicola]
MRAVAFGLIVHLLRFGLIWAGSSVAPIVGITGWWIGLFVNALCVLFAVILVTRLHLWRASGFLTAWRGWMALAALSLPVAEAAIRSTFGLEDRAPGVGWWALTLLLVGINEELISRVVVLHRMALSFPPVAAVALTAALFGAQHLSAFATTDRTASDILLNVVASACYGFALAAFQCRFSWIWPLMLVHAAADFTTILSRFHDPGDVLAIVTSVGFAVYGLILLRRARGTARAIPPRVPRTADSS